MSDSSIKLASCRMSVANILEASMVLEGRGGRPAAEIEAAPVTAEQLEATRDAWRRYGKGNHPAALNFGDCFAYALARTTGEPLLFKGEDFAQTDVLAA